MDKLITFCQRFALPLVLAWLTLSIVSGVAASNLKLVSELERLLPEDAEAVRNLRRLEDVYGKHLDRFTILVEGDDPEENLAAVEELSEALVGRDHVVGVEYKRPTEFFEKYRLLYMDTEDVDTIAAKLTERIKWERKRANPLFVGLGDDKPPELDFSAIEDKYSERFGTEPYLANEDRTKFALTVELDYPSDDINQTEQVLEDLRPVIDGVLAEREGVTAALTGRYNKRIEQRDSTARDLGRGTSLAFVLIFGFLLFYFRSVKAPMLLTIPLIAGTLCTFGAAWLVFETLNILTGFVGSVLMGLGIDYGIHLAARYRTERARHDAHESLVVAYESAGRASLFAALTTVAALGSLALSSFQAFFEFGLLALIGMTSVGLAYGTLFPALVLLLDGTKFSLNASREEPHEVIPWREPRFTHLKRASLGLILMLLPLAMWGMTRVGFQYDFHELMPVDLPSLQADERLSEFGSVGRVPGVILVEDQEHAEAVVEELHRRKKELGEAALIDRTLALHDLIPTQQAQKLETLDELRVQFEKLPKKVLRENEELAPFYEELVHVTDRRELGRADLPKDLSRRFSRLDDPNKTIVLVFPPRIIHDARDAIAYSDQTSDLPASGDETNVDAIGEEPIMRDIIKDLRGDTVWMLLVTLGAILAVALIAFRSGRRIALVFGTITLGFAVAAGLVGGAGVKFNFINMIILPIWLGLGVDAAFHMMTRLEEEPRDSDGFWHTVGAVLAAFGTTMIGFGAMMVSTHRGLASLGHVAIIGLGAIFVLSVAIQLLALKREDALGE